MVSQFVVMVYTVYTVTQALYSVMLHGNGFQRAVSSLVGTFQQQHRTWTDTSQSQSQSCVTADGQWASLPWCHEPIWDPRTHFCYFHNAVGLLIWGAFSYETVVYSCCLVLQAQSSPDLSATKCVAIPTDSVWRPGQRRGLEQLVTRISAQLWFR
jgi:hypothetical protein